MEIVDANIILRYLLDDVEELSDKACQIVENNEIFIPNEIIAEVVYVLQKVYKVIRGDIKNYIGGRLKCENVKSQDRDILLEALEIYSTINLDFIDSLLLSYSKIKKYRKHTFDKKLEKLLKRNILSQGNNF
jgi:predicted nucleic-acid-binding protein